MIQSPEHDLAELKAASAHRQKNYCRNAVHIPKQSLMINWLLCTPHHLIKTNCIIAPSLLAFVKSMMTLYPWMIRKMSSIHSLFAVSFHSQEVTLESSLTVVWFSWTNHKSLLSIATSETASFCRDIRLSLMARVLLSQQRPAGFRVEKKLL